MSLIVAAPDKFRGTATALEVADAIGRAGVSKGWRVDKAPMSDGGEGLLDVLGGHARFSAVCGPLGQPVEAQWRMLGPSDLGSNEDLQIAVIEMAQAAGRDLLVDPVDSDPVAANTKGVGMLILQALDEGAKRIIVGCGGSATSDGGWGAVEAIGTPDRLNGTELVVASDVTTSFRDAGVIFGPQKGATPDQVKVLSDRLAFLAHQYRRDYGVDVDSIPGAGAAGGLAGGLAALGARILPGFELVADLVNLKAKLSGADLVVTGEGYLDESSFEGKVVGSLYRLVGGKCKVVCVVGDCSDAALEKQNIFDGLEIISLVRRFGSKRAHVDTVNLVEEVVGDYLER